jgi:hypothetical protein
VGSCPNFNIAADAEGDVRKSNMKVLFVAFGDAHVFHDSPWGCAHFIRLPQAILSVAFGDNKTFDLRIPI